MRILLIYFTGTGNTLRVVNTIKDNLKEHEVDVADVTKEFKDINGYDSLIISYPIFAFNAPKPIVDYVKKLSNLDKIIPCLIMKQSGEYLFWNNASSLKIISILKRKNIKVTNEYHYLMPYSFIFRHSDYMAYKMDQTMTKLVPLDLVDFLNHKEHHLKRFFLDRLFAFILRIQWWGGRLNGKYYKVDTSKCIKCMKCVKECPTQNIEYKDDKFVFSNKCLMCERCVMYCQAHAIKAGLFDSWRVDIPYTFKEAPYQKEVKPNYCKKAYERYFKEAENRISLAQKKN